MTGKNNQQEQIVKQVPHYGLRKLSIGVASVLLSTAFYLGATQIVGHADTVDGTPTEVVNEGSTNQQATPSQPLQSNQSSDKQNAANTTNQEIPTAQHSLNDQVGTANDQIRVIAKQITEQAGNKEAGTTGQTNLHLELSIPADQQSKISAGDYIDVKLGIPYTTKDGQQHVMSYGAVNDKVTPMIERQTKILVAYIIPEGNFNQYAQTVNHNGQLVVDDNDNKNDGSLGTSNGFYRIIFTDNIKKYLTNNSVQSIELNPDLNLYWYNAVQNNDKKVTPPTDITIYTSSDNTGDYVPTNDLQVGNQVSASGLKFKVVKIDSSNNGVQLSDETRTSDHTGNIPAHRWAQNGNKQFLITGEDNTQGVGISLSTKDNKGNSLGQSFDITVSKPASNADVQMNFVSADDVRRQIQEAVVGKDDQSHLVDAVNGSNGEYYLNHQNLFSQPVVSVTADSTNNGNTITYHVKIDGPYQGFKTNMADKDFIMTLINWKPTDSQGLLPPSSITDYEQDRQHVTYKAPGNYLAGYPIQDHKVKDYLNNRPWNVTITSQSGFNYQQTEGYWIDSSRDVKPDNSASISSHMLTWVKQTIHYVDENGNPMTDDQGNLIPDTVRNVDFESDSGLEGFTGTKQFDDLSVPVINGYKAYVGLKDSNNNLQKDGNGKATLVSEDEITKYGAEEPFEYNHPDFVEYVVYKKDQPVVQKGTVAVNYIDLGINPAPKNGYQPSDGTPISGHDFTIDDQVGAQYDNSSRLWAEKDFQNAGYQLVYADNGAQSGQVTAEPQTYYVYLKHITSPLNEQKTVKETIHYVYANGPKAGQTAAPDYHAEFTFTRDGYHDQTTNQDYWNS